MVGYAYSFDNYHWSLPEFGKIAKTAIERALESARVDAGGEETVYIGRCVEVEPGTEDFSIKGLMEEISTNFSDRAELDDIDFGVYFKAKQWDELGERVWKAIKGYLEEEGELEPHYYRIENPTPYDLTTGRPTIMV